MYVNRLLSVKMEAHLAEHDTVHSAPHRISNGEPAQGSTSHGGARPGLGPSGQYLPQFITMPYAKADTGQRMQSEPSCTNPKHCRESLSSAIHCDARNVGFMGTQKRCQDGLSKSPRLEAGLFLTRFRMSSLMTSHLLLLLVLLYDLSGDLPWGQSAAIVLAWTKLRFETLSRCDCADFELPRKRLRVSLLLSMLPCDSICGAMKPATCDRRGDTLSPAASRGSNIMLRSQVARRHREMVRRFDATDFCKKPSRAGRERSVECAAR